MCNKTTGAGCCPRIFLTIFNLILFLIGLGLFIFAAVLKWNLLDKLDVNYTEILEFKDMHIGEYLNTAIIVLMCVAAFIMVITMAGLLGALCANKCLLYVYMLVIALLFIAHLAVFILYLVKRPIILDEVDSLIKKKAELLVSNNTSNADKTAFCVVFKSVSDLLTCCGANGPEDFADYSFMNTKQNTTVNTIDACCVSKQNVTGCANEVKKLLDSADLLVILTPNIGLLTFEFVIFLLIIGLIWNISTKRRQQDLNEKYKNKSDYYSYEMQMNSSRPRPSYNI